VWCPSNVHAGIVPAKTAVVLERHNVSQNGVPAWRLENGPSSTWCRGIVYYGPGGERMIKTIKATIEEQGNVKLREPVKLPSSRRALVTILKDAPVESVYERALLSEPGGG
jgi:hypothetical protein